SDGKRPDGISQFPWKRGQFLVWDYSCIDPLALSNQSLNILEIKELLKIAKYSEISQNHLFIPIISTTLTTFGNRAFSFFKELGSLIRKLTDEPREGFFLRRRLAIAIYRANYISFMGSLIPQDDKNIFTFLL
ncbi:unnamed protein product, partial [Gordionus sp. m RMFG-2023]